MVSHDMPADAGDDGITIAERQARALRRLDDGHAALLQALADLDDAEAFLGSRWSVWEVMQHLLTENFVEALEEIAAGQREMLPAFDARASRVAADTARLEANYQRFRKLIAGLSEAQLSRPATPPNPENNFPSLSLLELIERVAGHEGNHARQVSETRKFVAAFSSAQRAVTVAGLGAGGPAQVPAQTRELLANADYVAGSDDALALARRWLRGVELPLRDDNLNELANRLGRDARAGLWSMVVTLGNPAESAPNLLHRLQEEAAAVSIVSAPGFYQAALAEAGVSPLDAVCTSAGRISDGSTDGVLADRSGRRAVVVLGADSAGDWTDIGRALAAAGVAPAAAIRLVTGMANAPQTLETTLSGLAAGSLGQVPASVDSALILQPLAA